MVAEEIKSIFLIVFLLVLLLYLQRVMQREVQSIFLLLTRQAEIAVMLFSILFFPGVLLHETSHFLMAHLLGVRTGKFSILPRRLGNGRLQLGYVETASTDFFRDALIGAAPLIAGGIFVGYAGLSRLGLNQLWETIAQNQLASLSTVIASLMVRPDFWLWFYLTFAVSSTMMPSASDRRAWLPLLIIFVILFLVLLLSGAGSWVYSKLSQVIDSGLQTISIVFGITVLIHSILIPPAWLLRKIISRLTGYKIV